MPGKGIEELRQLQLGCEGFNGLPGKLSEEELDALCLFTGTISQAIGGTYHTAIVLIPRGTKFTRDNGLQLVALSRTTQSTIIVGHINDLWYYGCPEVSFSWISCNRWA